MARTDLPRESGTEDDQQGTGGSAPGQWTEPYFYLICILRHKILILLSVILR